MAIDNKFQQKKTRPTLPEWSGERTTTLEVIIIISTRTSAALMADSSERETHFCVSYVRATTVESEW